MNGGKRTPISTCKNWQLFQEVRQSPRRYIIVQGDKKIRDHLQSCWHDIIRFLNSGCEQSFKLQNTVDCVLMC